MPSPSTPKLRGYVLGLAALCAIAPFGVGVSVLLPVVLQYRAGGGTLNERDVDAWLDYANTAADAIDEVNAYRSTGLHGAFRGEDAVAGADDILNGHIDIPPFGSATVSWPFDPQDLLQGSPTLQLFLASLAAGDILLEAYEHTGDDRYLDAASRRARAVLDHERSLWLPEGFIRNDHAVAARSVFTTRLLSALARQPVVDRAAVRDLLESLDRSVRLLAKPTYFTYQSNHGLMQSLAVMHVAVVAPTLPTVSENLETVIERTDRQLEYFVSEDGVVTEHSATYQRLGVSLMGMLLEYMSILGRPVPEHWLQRYDLAKGFLRHLTRPDGTLPRYGDTDGAPEPVLEAIADGSGQFVMRDMVVDSARDPVWSSPTFGYWSEWRGGAHLLAGWADFSGRAHKHADELGLIYWSDGEEWWTASGYWPYGDDVRELGIGWTGSNAPHALNESPSLARSSRLLASYSDTAVTLLHLERQSPSGFQVQRTIVRAHETWVVIDVPGGADTARAVWQTPSSIAVDDQDTVPAVFRLRSSRSSTLLAGTVLLGPGSAYRWERGSDSPFLGWVVEEGTVLPSDALVLETPPGSWSAIAWRVSEGGVLGDAVIRRLDWRTAESWSIELGSDAQGSTLIRAGDRLRFGTPAIEITLNREPGSDRQSYERAEAAYRRMQTEVPHIPEYLFWRVRMFKLAMIAAAGQLIGLLGALLWLKRHPKYSVLAMIGLVALLIAHVGLGFYLHLVYFAP